MTDPTGRSFLSYRRERLHEARLLIEAQHDIGIPTWQDIRNLYNEPTEEALRSVLSDPNIANAVMWLTPEVQHSTIIQRVEAPLILSRYRKQDGFFVVPVAAGKLTYEEAAVVVEGSIGIENLQNWNIMKVPSDPASTFDIQKVVLQILQRRIDSLNRCLPPYEPFKLMLNTRVPPAFNPGFALIIDWTHRFTKREAAQQTWNQYLLPALNNIADIIQQQAPTRSIQATGLLSIPAAIALGFTFMAPRRVNIEWEQFTPGRDPQKWSISETTEESGFKTEVIAGQASADDLAVMVSVNTDVSNAVSRSKASLPTFRAFVHVKHFDARGSIDISSPGQATHLARMVVDTARQTREDYRITGRVHLFMAVPVGLAMLIGQLLNTLGQVQTYEHIQNGAIGFYSPAALLGL